MSSLDALWDSKPNVSAIAYATSLASNYKIPSVDQIFAAGIPKDQVNQALIFTGDTPLYDTSIWPYPIGNLYYNVSYLWPQFDITGPIFMTETYCNPKVCSLLFGSFLYIPNFGANLFFTIIFGLAMLLNIALGIKQRTWGYMVGMVFGTLCEVLGYVGRILMNKNIYASNPFYIYIVCLTIGPAFLSFSIYTCLARIILVYGRECARFKPKTYTYVFAVSDFFSLVLQGAGGGLAATGTDQVQSQRGINIMIAGLAWQVFSLSMFIIACVDVALGIRRVKRTRTDDTPYISFQRAPRFKAFLAGLAIATITIYIRCVFRVAELRQGFHSRLINNEATFMVLEGAMVVIATIALTAVHPTIIFGGLWREVSSQMYAGKKKGKKEKKTKEVDSS